MQMKKREKNSRDVVTGRNPGNSSSNNSTTPKRARENESLPKEPPTKKRGKQNPEVPYFLVVRI